MVGVEILKYCSCLSTQGLHSVDLQDTVIPVAHLSSTRAVIAVGECGVSKTSKQQEEQETGGDMGAGQEGGNVHRNGAGVRLTKSHSGSHGL